MARFTSSAYMLQNVTATGATTSARFDVSLRHKLSIQVTAASITSGNGVFTVLVSNDDVTYVPYNRLISNVNKTNTQTDIGESSITLSSDTSDFLFFPVGDYFRYIKVAVTVTTDGSYSAYLEAID